MNITSAKISANLIRLLYRLKLISVKLAEKMINVLTVRVLEADLKEKEDDSSKR
jgi:hypothetical protein